MALFNNKQRVCLVLKDHVIRFIDSSGPTKNGIKAFGERYLPPGVIREGKILERDTLLMILSEVIDEWKIKGKSIFFCVPDSFVVVRKQTIPADIPEDEIKGYLFLEIGETIHLPFEDAQFDFSIIHKNEEFTEIVLIASPRNVIDEYSSILEEVKLKPKVADLSSLSIYRLYDEFGRSNEEEHLMSIQFDIRTVNVTVFHEHVPQFTRHMKMNLDHELWKVEKNEADYDLIVWTGNLDEMDGQVDEMLSEIERMMSFYRFSVNQGKAGISKVLLTGDHPHITLFYEKINNMGDFSVDLLQDIVVSTAKGETIPIHFFEIVGLSLKEEVQ